MLNQLLKVQHQMIQIKITMEITVRKKVIRNLALIHRIIKITQIILI